MDIFFADDARQGNPSRPGMGELVAIGGIYVPGHAIGELERALNDLCAQTGFPPGEEFKWSPGRELWMRDNLVEEARKEFFFRVLHLARSHGAVATIIVEDANYKTATQAASAEEDVACLFLERAHLQFSTAGTEGIVVVDRPSGGRADEERFLAGCLETLQSGTRYVRPDHIALNVLSTPSRLVRLLQVADVVTSCTVALVGGEDRFSPPVFDEIKPLLPSDMERIGGIGLKIHPDYMYANLYYWLLGDPYLIKRGSGSPLPLESYPYASGPNQP
jgi:hypothetical protein